MLHGFSFLMHDMGYRRGWELGTKSFSRLFFTASYY